MQGIHKRGVCRDSQEAALTLSPTAACDLWVTGSDANAGAQLLALIFLCGSTVAVYPNTRRVYGILRIKIANPKHSGTAIMDTKTNFRIVGMLVEMNKMSRAITMVLWIM